MDDSLQTTLVINAVAVWGLQWLKGTKFFPWLTAETEKLNRIASALVAALASAGMVFTIAHVGGGGTGDITLHYAGVTAVNAVHFLWHGVGNYASQKALFKIFYSGAKA